MSERERGRGGGRGAEDHLERRRARPASLQVGRLGPEAAARVQLWADTEPPAETGRRWAGSDGEEVRVLCFHCNYN